MSNDLPAPISIGPHPCADCGELVRYDESLCDACLDERLSEMAIAERMPPTKRDGEETAMPSIPHGVTTHWKSLSIEEQKELLDALAEAEAARDEALDAMCGEPSKLREAESRMAQLREALEKIRTHDLVPVVVRNIARDALKERPTMPDQVTLTRDDIEAKARAIAAETFPVEDAADAAKRNALYARIVAAFLGETE